MMRKLYSVRDVKIGYGVQELGGIPAILDMPNDDVAIRVLKGSCAQGATANVFNTNPEDKELWCVGEFDQKTGIIKPCEPYLVGRAIDYLQRGVVDDKSSEITKEN